MGLGSFIVCTEIGDGIGYPLAKCCTVDCRSYDTEKVEWCCQAHCHNNQYSPQDNMAN